MVLDPYHRALLRLSLWRGAWGRWPEDDPVTPIPWFKGWPVFGVRRKTCWSGCTPKTRKPASDDDDDDDDDDDSSDF